MRSVSRASHADVGAPTRELLHSAARFATVPREAAQRSELQHVLRTFFSGSAESALATLLDIQPGELTDDARRRMKRLIDKAAKEGR